MQKLMSVVTSIRLEMVPFLVLNMNKVTIWEIFSFLAKSIIPLMNSGAKAIGKQVLQRGAGFVSDVPSGKEVKQVLLVEPNLLHNNL